MLILPVLDLKNGVVVRGVAGRRDEYRPIESRLAADARPATVARAFVEQLGLREGYLADLDAIAGAAPAWSAFRAAMQAGLRLWVDAGVREATRAAELATFSIEGAPLARVIAGLESLDSPAKLTEIVSVVGVERIVFSLDLKHGAPLLSESAQGWSVSAPLAVAATAADCGVRAMIVLDLARVGVGSGAGTEDLCREISRKWPHIELIGGGGVRALADLRSLQAAGCRGALVASALHDGRLSAADLAAV